MKKYYLTQLNKINYNLEKIQANIIKTFIKNYKKYLIMKNIFMKTYKIILKIKALIHYIQKKHKQQINY